MISLTAIPTLAAWKPFANHALCGGYTDLYNHLFGIVSAFVKFAIIFFVLVQLLAGCSRHDNAEPVSGDTEIRKKMIGTWYWADTSEVGGYLKGALTVESNGNYVCVIERTFSNAIPRRIELQGTQEIKNGIWIDTITKSTVTDDHLPRINRKRVIRIDDRELVLRLEGEKRDVTMSKVNK